MSLFLVPGIKNSRITHFPLGKSFIVTSAPCCRSSLYFILLRPTFKFVAGTVLGKSETWLMNGRQAVSARSPYHAHGRLDLLTSIPSHCWRAEGLRRSSLYPLQKSSQGVCGQILWGELCHSSKILLGRWRLSGSWNRGQTLPAPSPTVALLSDGGSPSVALKACWRFTPIKLI